MDMLTHAPTEEKRVLAYDGFGDEWSPFDQEQASRRMAAGSRLAAARVAREEGNSTEGVRARGTSHNTLASYRRQKSEEEKKKASAVQRAKRAAETEEEKQERRRNANATAAARKERKKGAAVAHEEKKERKLEKKKEREKQNRLERRP